MERFTLTFYGTRGSRTVCGPQYTEFGGDTTCIVVRAGDRTLVFDSGSGIVAFGKEFVESHLSSGAPGPLTSHIFQTHCHYDHICGLPYYAPLYIRDTTTRFYGPRNPVGSFESAIRTFIHTPYHPVPMYEMEGEIEFTEIREPHTVFFVAGDPDPVVANDSHSRLRSTAPNKADCDVVVYCMRGFNHPKSGVMFYRIEHAGRSVVVATDTEGYPLGDRRLIRFSRGATVLIHDGMYTKEVYASEALPTQGWGHSTIDSALLVAEMAGVQRVYLVHHDPNHDDADLRKLERQSKTILAHAALARDRTSVDLIRSFPLS
jgi:ribonuclease BN (tRNA processing enzyme)